MKQLVERSGVVLSSEVLAICIKGGKGFSIGELSKRIYGNTYPGNRSRVFVVVEVFLKHNVLVPVFRDGVLLFRYNNGVEGKKQVEGR